MLALVAGALIVAAAAGANAVTNVVRNSNPALALRFSPWDAGANATMADETQMAGAKSGNPRLGADRARTALARTPLSPVSVRVVGFAAEADGQKARARGLFLQSASLSRRDLLTRIWLIEDAVARDDAAGALKHYDIAMRPSRLARTILFPVLTNAVSDREMVRPVTQLLNRNPNWGAEFVLAGLASGKASEHISQIVARSPGLVSPDANLRQAVLDQLVREKRFAAARRFYAAVEKSASDNLTINDPRFAMPRGLTPFAWNIVDEGTVGAERDNGLRLFADSTVGGTVATQLLTLPAGRYHLSSTGASRSGDRFGGAEWRIECATDTPGWTARLALPAQTQKVSTPFLVPPGCSAQWIRLIIRASQAPGGVEGTVSEVRIDRVAA